MDYYIDIQTRFMNDIAVQGKAKQALSALDSLDCVKALTRARDIVYMLELKCKDAEQQQFERG